MEVDDGLGVHTYHMRVGQSGRVSLPPDLRERNKINIGDTLVVVDREGQLEVKTMSQAIRQAQDYFTGIIPRDVSLVDELIAERREEALRE